MGNPTDIPTRQSSDTASLLREADGFASFMYLPGSIHSVPYGGFPSLLLTGHTPLRFDDALSGTTNAFGIVPYEAFHADYGLATSAKPHFYEVAQQHPFLAIPTTNYKLPIIDFHLTTDKYTYVSQATRLKEMIYAGEVYELNYCIAWEAQCKGLDVIATFLKMYEKLPNPFAALYKTGTAYVLCFSPERFLKKEGRKLISQPIKGTSARGNSTAEDQANKTKLSSSEKEQAENMMITDLVRNDLARSCDTGSVTVEELMGIYTYPTVHQMISTVTGKLSPNTSAAQAFRHAFPMGSMTGAPKRAVIHTLAQTETHPRGFYSGALGFATATGDFDFNVVIRSIVYDSTSGKLSIHAGSAITADSEPEQEWNECLLKSSALISAFQ